MNTPLDTVTTNTPRVALRAMEPEDLDWLYAVENNREVWNVGNTNVPYSRYVLHDYIANATNDIYNDGQVRLIVENEEHLPSPSQRHRNILPSTRKVMLSSPNGWSSVTPCSDNVKSLTCSMFIQTDYFLYFFSFPLKLFTFMPS